MTAPTHTPKGTRLERPHTGRVLAGVSTGIARYLQISTGLVRLMFIFATIFGGFGILAYIAAWLFIPAEGQSQPVAGNWIKDLNTQGSTTGALLVGVLAFLVIVAFIPGGKALAVALLIVGVLVIGTRNNTQTTQ